MGQLLADFSLEIAAANYQRMLETSGYPIRHFRIKAMEVRMRAVLIRDSDLRQRFTEVASGYDALADVIERRLYRH
jgi:hypothetical protein